MPFADVDDATLFYTDAGTGDPALLFVHGYSCDSHDWSWQIPHFVQRHRVVAVDNRGHGRSSIPAGGYESATFANDLASLLEQISCGPVVVIGHSLGGVIASTMAVERPDLVRGVVNIDPGYLMPDLLMAGFASMLDDLDSNDPTAVAQAALGSMYSPATPPALKTWHMRRIEGMPHHVLRQTLRSLMEGPALESVSAPYLARRECPVLTLYADLGRAPVETALFGDQLSRVVTFEGSGHWLHQERPDEVNHLIDSWLAGLPRS